MQAGIPILVTAEHDLLAGADAIQEATGRVLFRLSLQMF
jgi:hypothetical protein